MKFGDVSFAPGESRFLVPGDWTAGEAGDVYEALLGSSVAIVLWHSIMRVGAICHYAFPRRSGQRRFLDSDGRYGNEAFDLILNALADRHIPPMQCRAKMLGGARVFGGAQGHEIDIGAQNIVYGFEMLAASGIEITMADVGGARWRSICVDIGVGEVWASINPREIAREHRCVRGAA